MPTIKRYVNGKLVYEGEQSNPKPRTPSVFERLERLENKVGDLQAEIRKLQAERLELVKKGKAKSI